jgi:hypothetical protein
MDRAKIIERIELAEKHIALAQCQAAAQRRIITDMVRAGRDTDAAKELLAEFEETLSVFSADVEGLKAEVRASE